jgi:xanthine dehydrogenase YagT iron-sulfur-binding subunit
MDPQGSDPKENRARPLGSVSRRGLLTAAAFGAGMAVMPWLNGCAGASRQGAEQSPPQPPPPLPGTEAVTLQVNGQSHSLRLDPRVTLLDALREDLGLTGTKKGCDHGQCGACTILVDGRRVNSCLTLAIAAQGKSITTIEGLASGDSLHPMQTAFIEHDAFQCGYCTPGQICSAVGLISEGHAASDDDIREQMAGNICRCGAYPNIVSAVGQVIRNKV